MRRTRLSMVLLLLALGLVGAYFGVRGQDPRLPWPPPPVTPTNFVETNPPTKAKSTTALPPAPAPKPAAEPAPAPPMPPPLPRSETPASAAPEKALTPVRYETAIPTLPARTPDKHSSPPAPAPPIIESPKAESGAGNPSAFTIPQIPTAPPIPTLDQLNNIAVAAPDPAPARIPDMQKPLETKGRDPVIIEASATAPKPSVQPGAPPAIVSEPTLITVPPVAEPVPAHSSASPFGSAPVNVAIQEAPLPKGPPQEPLFPQPAPVESPAAQAPTTVSRPQPEPISARPRAFQLVNPIRRPESAAAPSSPLEAPGMAERPLVSAQPVSQAHTQGNNLGPVTPQLTIEKRAGAAVRASSPVPFTIVVRNVGPTTASNVRVEDELPAGAQLVVADPQPLRQADRAVWIIPSLPAGAEKRITLELNSRGAGEGWGTTSVWVSASTVSSAPSAAPPSSPAPTTPLSNLPARAEHSGLTLTVKNPAPALVGYPVVFEIVATNQTTQPITGLVLYATLPAGLSHSEGKDIEAPVGVFNAKATRRFPVSFTAVQPGEHTVQFRLGIPGGPEVSALGTVQVKVAKSTGLTIDQPASVKLFLDKESELRVRVTNHQSIGLKNVAVMDTLPEGVEFIAASDRGLYRADARLAHWLIDYLAPGESKTVSLRISAKQPGEFTNLAAVRTENQQEIRSSAKVDVERLADLAVQVTGREKAIEVGKPATYEIKVTNQGSATATGVQVQATLPDGMAPAQARGPSRHRIEGRQVLFAALPQLRPQGQAVYTITALAQAPGEQLMRAEVACDQGTLPIAREERTLVYRD